MYFPLNFNDRAIAKVTGEQGRVDGGRHEDHTEGGVCTHHVSHHHQEEVRLREGEENEEDDEIVNS